MTSQIIFIGERSQNYGGQKMMKYELKVEAETQQQKFDPDQLFFGGLVS